MLPDNGFEIIDMEAENKINIAKLLKDCPKGMELDYALFEDTIFIGVEEDKNYPILIKLKDGSQKRLTKYGCHSNADYAKCVIFPKGKTTWEGFQRPFKDGDIVAYDGADGETQLYICEDQSEINHCCLCYLRLDCDGELDLDKGWYYITRFATEEEKQKLFDTIKENGYKWNQETKTLEKLFEPKFKAGDRVKHVSAHTPGVVLKVGDKGYYIDLPKNGGVRYISFTLEKDYELAPSKFDINTLVPFESRVLVRNNERQDWKPAFWGYLRKSEYVYDTTRGIYGMCIPYEGNEHLLGTTDDCDNFYKTWEK